MTKTIEEWRVELNDLAMKSATEAAKMMVESQTEIMIAFMAKYGLHPNECILCYQGNKFWVEKKDIPDTFVTYELIKAQKSYNELSDQIPKWIDVKTKLPENRQIVLVINEQGEMAVCECKIHENEGQYIFMLYETSHQIINVTHWMDLPEAPKCVK